MGLKQEIEVILFWKNQSTSLANLSERLNCNPQEVKKALMDLIREYELRDSGLHIVFRGNGYILEPKDEYLPLAQKLVPIDLKTGSLRTLALIALKEPVRQTDIVDLRGSGAYEHIRELSEANWILKEPSGLTYNLRTTPAFKKHFRLSEDGDKLKDKLKQIFSTLENTPKSDEEESNLLFQTSLTNANDEIYINEDQSQESQNLSSI